MTFKILILIPLLYDPFIGRDKTKHFGASYIIAQVTYQKTRNIKKAIFFTGLIGVAKELYDLKVKKTKFSLKDLFWDTAGLSTGIIVSKYF